MCHGVPGRSLLKPHKGWPLKNARYSRRPLKAPERVFGVFWVSTISRLMLSPS